MKSQRKKMVLAIYILLIIGVAIVGICTNNRTMAAEEEPCEHEYVVKFDEANHWEECTKCGKVKADTISEHSYSDGICECGACKVHEYVMKHDDTNHWEECKKCALVKADSKVAHTYTNGECECGAKEPGTEEPCEHEYVMKHDETNHWEECTKCGEIKADSKVAHTYTNGECECGAKDPEAEEPCEHEYVMKHDETNHWEECTKCGEVKADSKVAHTYKKYTDNKDGTHSAICSVCEYELTEKHDPDEDCPDCGYTKKVDNTITDKDIPYTGISSIVAVTIIALSAVAVISVIKIRKYKGI